MLQFNEMGQETAGTWSGVRDLFRDPEPEVVGLTPPTENLFEPRRGFGKTWRDLYAGPDGTEPRRKFRRGSNAVPLSN